MKTITASVFKAKCLKLMDEVAESGEALVITKHGKPLVQLDPVTRKRKSLIGAHQGRIRILGDILKPIDAEWEAGT